MNEAISNPQKGRLFAIVHVAGTQFKVTDNDLIKTTGKMVGVKLGDRIRLEKVGICFFFSCYIVNKIHEFGCIHFV